MMSGCSTPIVRECQQLVGSPSGCSAAPRSRSGSATCCAIRTIAGTFSGRHGSSKNMSLNGASASASADGDRRREAAVAVDHQLDLRSDRLPHRPHLRHAAHRCAAGPPGSASPRTGANFSAVNPRATRSAAERASSSGVSPRGPLA